MEAPRRCRILERRTFWSVLKNTVEGTLPKCLYLPEYLYSIKLFIYNWIYSCNTRTRYGYISLQHMVQATQYLWRYDRLCSAVTSVKPLKGARVLHAAFAAARRLFYGLQREHPVQHALQGLFPPGNQRTQEQERWFGATELLDESNYAKLLRFPCGMMWSLMLLRSRSKELNKRFLNLDAAVWKAYRSAGLEVAWPGLRGAEAEQVDPAGLWLGVSSPRAPRTSTWELTATTGTLGFRWGSSLGLCQPTQLRRSYALENTCLFLISSERNQPLVEDHRSEHLHKTNLPGKRWH